MGCKEYHTAPELKMQDLKCPKCGANATNDGFGSVEDCGYLHTDTILLCPQCGVSYTGKQYVKKVMKAKQLIKCPHCKGTGWVE